MTQAGSAPPIFYVITSAVFVKASLELEHLPQVIAALIFCTAWLYRVLDFSTSFSWHTLVSEPYADYVPWKDDIPEIEVG